MLSTIVDAYLLLLLSTRYFFGMQQGEDANAKRYLIRANQIWEKAYRDPDNAESDHQQFERPKGNRTVQSPASDTMLWLCRRFFVLKCFSTSRYGRSFVPFLYLFYILDACGCFSLWAAHRRASPPCPFFNLWHEIGQVAMTPTISSYPCHPLVSPPPPHPPIPSIIR